jgi:hypothetical protein
MVVQIHTNYVLIIRIKKNHTFLDGGGQGNGCLLVQHIARVWGCIHGIYL